MSYNFGLLLGLMFVGLLFGAPVGHPVFGAFCGALIAGGIIWQLGGDE